MKQIVLSAVAVLAMSSLAIGGGDIAPVEEFVAVEPVATDTGVYLGLAYSYLNEEYTRKPQQLDPRNFDSDVNAVMFLAGYKLNEYVAVEGRYTLGSGDDLDVVNASGQPYSLAGPDVWAMYVKPMYPVADMFDVYALLGYAYADQNSKKLNSVDGFSWGLGASYEFMENIEAFVDYTSLVDTDVSFSGVTKDYTIDAWNFGVNYKF